jgi:hypothetical protein
MEPSPGSIIGIIQLRLIELTIWIHILVQRVHIIKVVLRCNVRITILPLLKYQKYTMNLCLKILVENIIKKVFNMSQDTAY